MKIIYPITYNQNIQYGKWIPLEYINTLYNQIIPKVLDNLISKSQQDKWTNFFNTYNPNVNLGYASEEAYLSFYNLNTEHIIQNSILYIYPSLSDEDITYLVPLFLALIDKERIRVLNDTNQAVYIEILNVLSYIKQVEKLLSKFPQTSSEHKGSAFTTKYKTLANSQLNHLRERLHHSYFPIKDENEIDKTNKLIKIIEKSLNKEYKNLLEGLNFVNANFGLDSKFANLTELEEEVYTEFLNFYNGTKTEKSTIVKSTGFYIDTTFKKEMSKKEKASIIWNIIYFFFSNEIQSINKKNKKRTFSFNTKSIGNDITIKTLILNVPIFTPTTQENFFTELVTYGFSLMFDTPNDIEKLSNDEVDNITFNSEFLKEINLSNMEQKVFKFFILHYDTDQIVGKLPPQ